MPAYKKLIEVISKQSANTPKDDYKTNMLVIESDEHKLQFINDKPINVIKVGATWCGPCKDMQPLLDRLALQYNDGDVGFAIEDASKDLSPMVSAYPTCLFFYNGKLVLDDKGDILKVVGIATQPIQEQLQKLRESLYSLQVK